MENQNTPPEITTENTSKQDSYKISNLNQLISDWTKEYLTQKRNLIFFSILTVGFMGLACLSHFGVLPNTLWIQIPSWLLFLFFAFAVAGTNPQATKTQIDSLESNRRIAMGLPDTQKTNDEYFNALVNLNLENLDSYYLQVKTHSSQSFKVSLMVCLIGFILIAAGLVMGFKAEGNYIAYISTAAGVLVEFIAGALFYLYNKTVRQLKDYHDSLIEVQNVLLSFKLISDTTEAKSKTEMITKMIEYLVQKK